MMRTADERDPLDTITVPTKYAGGHEALLHLSINELLLLVKEGKITITRHESRINTMRHLATEWVKRA